jgi:hypothetical protein
MTLINQFYFRWSRPAWGVRVQIKPRGAVCKICDTKTLDAFIMVAVAAFFKTADQFWTSKDGLFEGNRLRACHFHLVSLCNAQILIRMTQKLKEDRIL